MEPEASGAGVAPLTHHRVSAPADQCTTLGPGASGAHQRCLPLLRKPRMELMELLKFPLLDRTSRHKACMMPAPLMSVLGSTIRPGRQRRPLLPNSSPSPPPPHTHTAQASLRELGGSTTLRPLQQRHAIVSKSLLVDGRRRCSGGRYTGQPERPLTEACSASPAPAASTYNDGRTV